MMIFLVIIYGALIGYIAYHIQGSGYGLAWDIYLGITGSFMASSLFIYIYFMNSFPYRYVTGWNLFSMAVDVIGSLSLIYAGWLYKKVAKKLYLQFSSVNN